MESLYTVKSDADDRLGTLSTDSPGKLDILRHDCHTLSMDSTQISVFKKSNKVGFRGLLLW